MQEKYYETSRGRVFYQISRCGKPGADTMVFLHGLTADHTMFAEQMAFFAQDYDVLCWDAPDHGRSRPYHRFSYVDCAAVLERIFMLEGIVQPILVGQSMGGFVVQTLLQRNPSAAKAMITIGTCPFGWQYYTRMDAWWLRQMGWMTALFPMPVLTHTIARVSAATPPGRVNMRTALQHFDKKALCHLLKVGYADFLQVNGAVEISCPVLLLVGALDRTGKVRQYNEAWHRQMGYPLYLIEGASHNANVDQAATVNAYIQDFLTRV